jgi:hypothetical protein
VVRPRRSRNRYSFPTRPYQRFTIADGDDITTTLLLV